MSPPCSSFERWLERLPFVRPVTFSRKRKSAFSQADNATRIASRAGSCTRRLNECRSSNGVDMDLPTAAARMPAERTVVDECLDGESRCCGQDEPRERAGRTRACGDQRNRGRGGCDAAEQVV